MPYIKGADRYQLDDWIEAGNWPNPMNAGELNYVFTVIALDYIAANGEKYQSYNDVIGALEGAKLELYRRHVAPYEDQKIKENGDV
jgi:hypothetical protein